MMLLFPWLCSQEIGSQGDTAVVPLPVADDPPWEVWEGVVRYVNGRRSWRLTVAPDGDNEWTVRLEGGAGAPSTTCRIALSLHQPMVWTVGGAGSVASWTTALIVALAQAETQLMHGLRLQKAARARPGLDRVGGAS